MCTSFLKGQIFWELKKKNEKRRVPNKNSSYREEADGLGWCLLALHMEDVAATEKCQDYSAENVICLGDI